MLVDFADEAELFLAIQKLLKLKRMNLQATSLTKIPSYAFAEPETLKPSITLLSFTVNGNLTIIEQYAFSGLTGLQIIDFYSIEIDKIEGYAFSLSSDGGQNYTYIESSYKPTVEFNCEPQLKVAELFNGNKLD